MELLPPGLAVLIHHLAAKEARRGRMRSTVAEDISGAGWEGSSGADHKLSKLPMRPGQEAENSCYTYTHIHTHTCLDFRAQSGDIPGLDIFQRCDPLHLFGALGWDQGWTGGDPKWGSIPIMFRKYPSVTCMTLVTFCSRRKATPIHFINWSLNPEVTLSKWQLEGRKL